MKSNKLKKANPLTKKEIQEAYQTVAFDLANRLNQAENYEKIHFTNIGTFEKKPQQQVSYLDGNTYNFYKISFRMSKNLKELISN